MARRFLLVLLPFLLAGSLEAAEISHAFVDVNTQQTTTSATYEDITGAALAEGNFTTDDKYLIVVSGQFRNTGDAVLCSIQTLHGSTAFADSLIAVSGTHRAVDSWWTIWTAIASEGIKLQWKVPSGTGQGQFFSILAINLSDLTENTDWFSAVRTNDDTLNIAFTAGASITFTPSAGDDWLVLTNAQINPSSVSLSWTSRLNRSGEASSTQPTTLVETDTDATNERAQVTIARVFNLGNVENIFKEESNAEADTTHTRLHSRVFALNLDKFLVHSFAESDFASDTALGTVDCDTEIETLSINPTMTTDVWMGTYHAFDKGHRDREYEFCVQVDAADQPANQSSASLDIGGQGNDSTDEDPMFLSTLAELTTGSKTVDVGSSADSAGSGSSVQEVVLWAVTMELADAAPPACVTYMSLMGVGCK